MRQSISLSQTAPHVYTWADACRWYFFFFLYFFSQYERVRLMMTGVLLGATEEEIRCVSKEVLDECILERQRKCLGVGFGKFS